MPQNYSWSWVETRVAQTIEVWESGTVHSAPNGAQYTRKQQQEREKAYDQGLRAVERELKRAPRTKADRIKTQDRIVAAFARFSATALDLEPATVHLLTDDFLPVGTRLAQWARQFDPNLGMADIIQACRNAWTACGLQPLLGDRMAITPSVLGYSLLYLYSDNYLDDPSVSREAKLGFSVRFGRRLAGDAVAPANPLEATIWRLIERIEEQYDRARWPDVFMSLLDIHRAQNNSIRLLRRGPDAQPVDVVKLSFDKNGASVLTDGYLAAGSLTGEEAQCVFCWGVFLQLADDLQDVRLDCQDGMLTVFSEIAGREPLDERTSRTLQFAQTVMRSMDRLPGGNCRELRELIERSSRSMLIRAAGETPDLYTRDYLAELETHSPFRFTFLNDRRTRLESRKGILNRLFEAFLAGDEDEPAFPLLPSSLMPRF